MASLSGRRRGGAHADYTWPGYVDALASLLMAFIFLISFYAVGQVALSSAVSDRDSAIDKLNAQLAALGDVLNVERATSADLPPRPFTPRRLSASPAWPAGAGARPAAAACWSLAWPAR